MIICVREGISNENDLIRLAQFYKRIVPGCLILFCIQSNINNPIKTGEGLDLGG